MRPTVRLQETGDPARNAPASAAAGDDRDQDNVRELECPRAVPIQTAVTEPAMYCPCPPMLKSPQRKAKATARSVRISAVVTAEGSAGDSLAGRFAHGSTYVPNGMPMQFQKTQARLKIALYVESGLLCHVDDEHDEAEQ